MGDQLSPFDDSSIQWETVTRKDGVPYKVGRKKIDCAEEENVVAAKVGKAKENFGIDVNWPVNNSSWVDVPENVATITGIRKYKLWKCNAINGNYCLQIYNDVTHDYSYDYCFYDETGDGYSLNTYLNREHYVQYDSTKPTILFITGS